MAEQPHLIEDLRKTWRTSAEQTATQAWRFLRLFLVTLVPQVLATLATGQSISKNTLREFLISVAVPTAEVVWRQLHPAMTASMADSAPGMTIVPDQVRVEPGAVLAPEVEQPRYDAYDPSPQSVDTPVDNPVEAVEAAADPQSVDTPVDNPADTPADQAVPLSATPPSLSMGPRGTPL